MYAPKCLNKHEKKYALKNDQNYHLFWIFNEMINITL